MSNDSNFRNLLKETTGVHEELEKVNEVGPG
jgi:hypothetical protein